MVLVLTLRVAGAQDPPPTYSRDIAPVLSKNCLECHHTGGHAPFSLETYQDVRPRAARIAAVTKTRYMPPWKPEPGYGGPFQGARGLSDQEIATIQRWISSGAAEGEPAAASPMTHSHGEWRLGEPDAVVSMPEPYELRADGPDVFRNFVLPIPTSGIRYVKALEFSAGSHAIHHANLRIDETSASRQRDLEDPAPGYDGLMAPSARYPEGYFLGWTPGQLPPMSPELAWRLNPGSDMVVQLHLRPSGKTERVQVAIGLYFTSEPPHLLPAMLRLGKQYLDIPPGAKDYIVTDSYKLPVDVDVHAVQPHAHYRARRIEGFATLPDGKTKWLIRISDWDFDWQDTYRYAEPMALPKGTTLTMRYTYDNSTSNPRNPQLPPQRVRWGQNSTDEMGDLWIQAVAHSQPELDLLVREFKQKVFREDILGYESVLAVTPNDVSLHDDVALLYMAVGRIGDAVTHFSQSVRLTPNAASAHFNLATALTAAGKVDDALSEYKRALQLKPDYAVAHNNLGSVLLARGNIKDAAVHLRRAIEIDPERADAQNNIGKLLAVEGHAREALEHLSKAIEIQPEYPDAHYNLAQVLLALNHVPEALDHYRTALRLRPDWPAVLKDTAWLLATHQDRTILDPGQAVMLAERAVALTARHDSSALDTLGAAFAAAGNFEKAAAAARAALDLIAEENSPQAVAIRQRLRLYQHQHAYVDTRQ